jgi:outer membrane protein OmpA-like peptidoglycan-associated protein
MASKKYLLLAGVLCLLASYSYSQRVGASYDVKDSSVVPSKRMPQHTEFLNGTYNFPAKPRNQWEIGLKGGMFNISGDVPSRTSWGAGAHVRKAFGYIFSLRLEYLYGMGKGLHWLPGENFAKNGNLVDGTGWVSAGYGAPQISPAGPGGTLIYINSATLQPLSQSPAEIVYYNYKTKVQDLTLQGVVTLNNIRFHKAKTGFVFTAFGGVGAAVYDAKIDALDGQQKHNFSSVPAGTHDNRKDVIGFLKDNVLDGEYETPADNHGTRRPKLFGQTLRFSGNAGVGIAYKLSNRINIALEDRISFVKDDLLDGQRWQESAYGDASLTRDYDSYNFLSLGLNINLGAKSVEPLWWLNPLDYAYSEIRNPRLMRLPKPVLPDSDGDGVTDQFDQEQTPQGCPVDSHGVSRDTDGDGVPDCKDKELITPTYCQPVDADGVGKCPCPDDCKVAGPPTQACAEKLGSLPSISFRAGSNVLSDDAKAVLATVAARMRNNPECKVVVIGYCSSNKREQQLSWDHVNKVISHLVESEGISADRFIFNYGQEGDCNTVDLRAANEGEEGPNTIPPPHPNLRKN